MAAINIVISKDGSMTAEADGFTGYSCTGPVDKLLSGLGVSPADVIKQFKPEAFDEEGVSEHT